MQRLPDGTYRFSPTDLIAFLESDFAAWCERDLADYFHDFPEITSLEWVARGTGYVIGRRASPGFKGSDPLPRRAA